MKVIIDNANFILSVPLDVKQYAMYNAVDKDFSNIHCESKGNGWYHIDGVASGQTNLNALFTDSSNKFTSVSGHKYLINFVVKNGTDSAQPKLLCLGYNGGATSVIKNGDGSQNYLLAYCTAGTYNIDFKLMLIDLTATYGEGNEPSTAELAINALDITTETYYAYNP